MLVSKFRLNVAAALGVAILGGSPAMAQVAAPVPVPAPAPPMPAMPGHAGHDDNLVPKVPTLLTGYGQGGFPVTTSSPAAQAFFDNGMQLAHAFAHKAAIAAFAEARRLDPACAMCAWGEAWSSGPTINYDKDAAEIAALATIADTAARLANSPAGPRATQRERDLIAALQSRYRGHNGDLAFAQAMDRLVTTYPTDNEIGTIAATSMPAACAKVFSAWLMLLKASAAWPAVSGLAGSSSASSLLTANTMLLTRNRWHKSEWRLVCGRSSSATSCHCNLVASTSTTAASALLAAVTMLRVYCSWPGASPMMNLRCAVLK